MGHADRSRWHYALSLDTQSRRLRLSVGWRADPVANSHTFGKCDANTKRDTYTYGNSYSYPTTNTDASSFADAENSSNSASSPEGGVVKR
jgi:hypothetical protein